jgi:hypothetical protein
MHVRDRAARTVKGVARVVPLAALLALGACALIDEVLNPPDEPQPVVAEPEAAPAAEQPLPPAPKPRPPARVARLPSPMEKATSTPAAQPSQPEPAPELAAPLPEIKLVGMSRGEAANLLGAPAEERDAAPAKIWKFSAGECAVDVYFYLDVKRNDFYALHYNVQDRNGATTGEAADRCLQRIYSENRK